MIEDEPIGNEIATVYRILRRLADSDPTCELVADRLSELRQAYPELSAYDMRVERFYPEEDWIDNTKVAEPTDLVAKAPQEALAELIEGGRPFYRWNYLMSVTDAVAMSHEWGYNLAVLLIEKSLWTSDLWEVMIRGWSRTEHSYSEWREILCLLQDHVRSFDSNIISLITWMLESAVQENDRKFPVRAIGIGLSLVEHMWDMVPAAPDSPDRDWLTSAINHAGGKAASFVLIALEQQRRAVSRTKFPKRYRKVLERFVNDQSGMAEMGRVVIASHLAFMFSVDQDWARQSLIPLFQWTNARTSQQCWHGFLIRGRLTRQLVPLMLPLMEATFEHASMGLDIHVNEHVGRSGLFRLLADVLMFYDQLGTNDKLQLALDLASKLTDRDLGLWTAEIVRHLQRLTRDDVQTQWNRWLCGYVHTRVTSHRRPSNTGEARQLLELPLAASPVFHDAVAIITRGIPPIDGQQTLFFSHVAKCEMISRFPLDVAHLLEFALSGSALNLAPYDCSTLRGIVSQLSPAGLSADQLAPLRRKLLNRGCITSDLVDDEPTSHNIGDRKTT